MTKSQKLVFFPSPYRDELLFSVVSRYHFRSANTNPIETTVELFDRHGIEEDSRFPFRLSQLSRKLSDNTLLTVERLSRDCSLLPLYFPFIATSQQTSYFSITSGAAESLHAMRLMPMKKAVSYWNWFGNIKNTFLRFCPICIVDDLRIYGEAFWHRAHQVRGIDVCHAHGEWLQDSEVPTKITKKRFNCILPSTNMIKTNNCRNQNGNKMTHHDLANSLYWLLNCNSTTNDIDKVIQKYHIELQRHGYEKHLGCVYSKDLKNDLVEFYKEREINTAPIERTRYDQFVWLKAILGKDERDCHPIDHLYMINFLGLSAERFMLESLTDFRPFGPGPWPCLNPAAPHFHEDVVDRCEVVHIDRSGSAEWVFSCSCGFHYTKRWPYNDDSDHYKARQIIRVGDLWEKELLRLKECQKKSYGYIANKLNIYAHQVEEYYRYITMKKERPNLHGRYDPYL